MAINPFCDTAPKKARVFDETEYISYKLIQKVAEGYDPKRPDEFLIEEEVVVDERIPISLEINSHRDKIGLKNLLKGIVSPKQMDDLISRTKSTGQNIDLEKFPDTHLAIEELAGNIDKIWDSIPAELKGTLTKEEFISSMTAKKLEDYIIKTLASKQTQEAKEGDSK